MNAQTYYSRLINLGRRANPTYEEAQRDLARLQELTTQADRHFV